MTLKPGTALGGYEILSQIGAGGMGEVYRARDSQLGRDVAIKVLPEFDATPDILERFEREAKAIAALNHPHIVTIYAIEDFGLQRFLVMELVEGQTLAEVIPDGGMAVEELLGLATSLADAIGAAHRRGVTHRDLKPANIMVNDDGRGKILDFGLAKLRRRDDSPAIGDEDATQALTRSGVVLGTIPYMSPEQVQGREVDHRSDIFSLGVVIYEMATGRLPFAGASSADQVAAILRDEAPSLIDGRPDLPRQLSRIVQRCLEKELSRRYQSAADLLHDLEGLRDELRAGSAPAPAVSTVAAERDEVIAVPELRYCKTADGVSIAYATLGQGPPLVRCLGWFTHLEVEWQWEAGRHFQQRLARNHLFVRYDGRGIGLSQRGIREFDLETRLLDLEAVIDAAGLERVALMGMSEGGVAAIAFANRHPERVSHLILYGTFAAGRSSRKADRDRWDSLIELMRTGWGADTPIYRRLFTQMFLGANADDDQIRYFEEMQRASASPETAASYQKTCMTLDVREQLARMRVPTLVIHRRGDLVVPFSAGVHLAQAIQGSRFLPMEGDNHWLFMRDPGMETYVSAIEDFLGTS